VLPTNSTFDEVDGAVRYIKGAAERGNRYAYGQQPLDGEHLAFCHFGVAIKGSFAGVSLDIIGNIVGARSIGEIVDRVIVHTAKPVTDNVSFRTRTEEKLGNQAMDKPSSLETFSGEFGKAESGITAVISFLNVQFANAPLAWNAGKSARFPRSDSAQTADLHPAFPAGEIAPFFVHKAQNSAKGGYIKL
jgi:hypothetical protein